MVVLITLYATRKFRAFILLTLSASVASTDAAFFGRLRLVTPAFRVPGAAVFTESVLTPARPAAVDAWRRPLNETNVSC
jgi:hypothetical protein